MTSNLAVDAEARVLGMFRGRRFHIPNIYSYGSIFPTFTRMAPYSQYCLAIVAKTSNKRQIYVGSSSFLQQLKLWSQSGALGI